MAGAARTVGDDDEVYAAGVVAGEAVVVVAVAADVGVRAATDARGEQAALPGVLQVFGAVRFGKGRVRVGRQVFPQTFRVGVDVQRLGDFHGFAVVADGDGKHDVAAGGGRAVDAACVAVPDEAAVLGKGDVEDGRVGRQFAFVGLAFVGGRQWREADARRLCRGGRGGMRREGHGGFGDGGGWFGGVFCGCLRLRGFAGGGRRGGNAGFFAVEEGNAVAWRAVVGGRGSCRDGRRFKWFFCSRSAVAGGSRRSSNAGFFAVEEGNAVAWRAVIGGGQIVAAGRSGVCAFGFWLAGQGDVFAGFTPSPALPRCGLRPAGEGVFCGRAIGDAIVLQGLFQRGGKFGAGMDEVLQAGVVGKQCAEEVFEAHSFSGVG